MRSVCIFTIAVVLLGFGPLWAADTATVTAVSRPTTAPNTASLGFFATSVIAGFQDPDLIVPCFNCVSGSGVVTMGIAVPLAAAQSGWPLTIVLTGDDLGWTGNASFQYSLISNGTTVMTGSVAASVYPAIWLAQFPTNAPAAGTYILEGIIWTGRDLTSKTVVVSPLIIF